MDVIRILGGVIVSDGRIKFGVACAVAIGSQSKPNKCPKEIKDKDFSATFDGNPWEVSWKWKNGKSPVLTNKVESYSCNLVGDKKAGFGDEIE